MPALRRKQFTESREEGASWPMGLAAALWLFSATGDGSRARRARWAAACWALATVVCIGGTLLLRCRLGVFSDRSDAYIDF
jgi:hypothetical protein